MRGVRCEGDGRRCDEGGEVETEADKAMGGRLRGEAGRGEAWL